MKTKITLILWNWCTKQISQTWLFGILILLVYVFFFVNKRTDFDSKQPVTKWNTHIHTVTRRCTDSGWIRGWLFKIGQQNTLLFHSNLSVICWQSEQILKNNIDFYISQHCKMLKWRTNEGLKIFFFKKTCFNASM